MGAQQPNFAFVAFFHLFFKLLVQ